MRIVGRRSATSTRTPARGRSMPRCRPSCSSTAPRTITACGRCSRATSRITAATCSPSICRATAAPAARALDVGRGDRRLDSRAARRGRRSASAALVGHSLGALAALECAARHPERVHAHRAARPRGADAGQRRAARRREARRSRRLRAHQRLVVQRGQAARRQHGAGHVADRQRDAAAWSARDPACCTPTSSRATPMRADSRAAAKVRCPALVILGARDIMAPPKNAQALIARAADERAVDAARVRPRADGRAAGRGARRAARLSRLNAGAAMTPAIRSRRHRPFPGRARVRRRRRSAGSRRGCADYRAHRCRACSTALLRRDGLVHRLTFRHARIRFGAGRRASYWWAVPRDRPLRPLAPPRAGLPVRSRHAPPGRRSRSIGVFTLVLGVLAGLGARVAHRFALFYTGECRPPPRFCSSSPRPTTSTLVAYACVGGVLRGAGVRASRGLGADDARSRTPTAWSRC